MQMPFKNSPLQNISNGQTSNQLNDIKMVDLKALCSGFHSRL